jgi:hypothetical protein
MHDPIADPSGPPAPIGRGEEWPERVDVHLAEGIAEDEVERWVQTASLLHSDGDAMDVAVAGGRIAGVRGRAVDRVNRGRLGPKDLFAWQANASPDRLTRPLVAGRPVSWDQAMGTVVERCRGVLEERSPAGVAFSTSGQLFAEEYWTVATIARAGIGTAHIDGNTRLCTATAGESLKESFGCDGQPGSYEDVNDCDALAMWGHNNAETQPVMWMRMRDRLAGPDPPRMLVVDPRRTVPARHAELHLALRAGREPAPPARAPERADRRAGGSTRRTSPGARSASRSCGRRWRGGRRGAPPRRAGSAPPRSGRRRSCWAPARRSPRRSCRASTSRTRRPRRRARSTTSTCCAGCSAVPGPGCCR